ncbi:uncharacterized protein PtrM4_153650 [Pyrenophora tritici-repentis]|uniref:Uncharacterized protein n=1 Tax=Pyrenophora tritici-repentis TaxID=45151 RepID=A0A834VGK6_9PLEO|nr:hypothetical protein PtrM4_153650 [Pyrenophora tritici-repentis]
MRMERLCPAPEAFSIGYSSSVTEWDLITGLPARHSDGNHSEVWCFAAQPRQKNMAKGAKELHMRQKLVAGCADGTIVLLSTEDNDLTFERFVSRATNKKARALMFDTRNGNVIRSISLGSGPSGGPKEILVWKVKCLPNGDFVSGDSTGDIRIYNGKNYSQVQRISGHEADVLDLAVTRDGCSIFSAGMDRRTCLYTSKKGQSGQSGKWRKVSHQRHHEHDVKTMATYEGNKLSVVVTGGIDTQPIVVPIRQFGRELSRGLPALPPTPPLTSAPDARLLVSWWNTEVRIWRVKPQDDGTEKPKVVARLALQGEENIISVSISEMVGFWLLQQPVWLSCSSCYIHRQELGRSTYTKARYAFDCGYASRIGESTASLSTRSRYDYPQFTERPSGSYERSIAHANFSKDGNVFAVVDLAGYVDTWVIEGHEDATAPEIDVDDSSPAMEDADGSDDEEESYEQITYLGQHWIRNPSGHLLPRLDATPVLLSFQPTPDASTQPVPNGNPAVHPTRQNPHPHSHELPTGDYPPPCLSNTNSLELDVSRLVAKKPAFQLPTRIQATRPPRQRLYLDISASTSQRRVWLYGEKWLFMFDLGKDLNTTVSDAEQHGARSRRW